MSRIPNEQPPTDNIELREWLSRMMLLINGSLDGVENPFNYVSVSSGDITTSGSQVLVCKNTDPINVILNPSAIKGTVVHIKRRGAEIEVIGTIDGIENWTINVPGWSMHLYFDGIDWSRI